MARYKGPKCRLCRRERVKLYLKGSKCEGDKCTLNSRLQVPGQHGNARRRRNTSDYGKQLREKQKAKRIYGVLEKQFRRYVEAAMKRKGVSGENLMQKLESRLDNLVYRGGFAVSRPQARQFIRSGYFAVNDKIAKTPSYQLRVDDIIKPVNFEKLHLREGFVLPEWLQANVKEKHIKYARMPGTEDFQEKIVDVQSIIEFYSR
jgi:small subunit ribosomal protein S4